MTENKDYYGLLKDRTVCILAGIPKGWEDLESSSRTRQDFEVTEAVTCLARAVLAAGGRLKVWADPEFALLCSMVAGEYVEPRFAETFEPKGKELPEQRSRVEIFASNEVLRDSLELLEKVGYISIVPCMSEDLSGSIRADAVVCIGGSPEMEDRLKIIEGGRESIPVFAITTTGGYARDVGRKSSNLPEDFVSVEAIDEKILGQLEELRSKLREERVEGPDVHRPLEQGVPMEEDISVNPYLLIMQCIVEKIASR